MKIVINGETVEVPSGGTSAENYSTEEAVIGTWIDGRPLYCRAWMGVNPEISANTYVEIFEIGEDSVVVDFSASRVVPNNKNLNTPGLKNEDGRIKILFYNGAPGNVMSAIVKYIKLTDEGS